MVNLLCIFVVYTNRVYKKFESVNILILLPEWNTHFFSSERIKRWYRT